MLRAPAEVPAILAARCEVAVVLGRRLGLGAAALRALEEAYERHDGKGQPRGHGGGRLSAPTRILAVAEQVAMFLPLPAAN